MSAPRPFTRLLLFAGLAACGVAARAQPCPLDAARAASVRREAPREHDLRFLIPPGDARLRVLDRVGAVYIEAISSRGELRKTGSGLLLDACHVLTAYHVVFPEVDLVHARKAVFQFDPQRVVRFAFGPRAPQDGKGSEFAHWIEGRPLDLGVFNPYARNYADELILIRLRQAAPADYAPRLALDGDATWTPGEPAFVVAGYPLDSLGRDGAYRLSADRCAILAPDRISGYATNCSLSDGVSGGPLLRVDDEADCAAPLRVRVAGVANQKDGPDLFPKDHPTRRSYVVPITRNRALLERALDRDPCTPPTGD